MISYQTEQCHTAVREGYRSLLTADSELRLPVGYPRICDYYRRVGEACVRWAEKAEGERLRQQYLAMEDHRDRARFRTARYRICCEAVWEETPYVTYLCRSTLQMETGVTQRIMAQVWNLEEETMLPMSEILKRFPVQPPKTKPPFRPDGIYPLARELVFYRNGDGKRAFAEHRSPRECKFL